MDNQGKVSRLAKKPKTLLDCNSTMKGDFFGLRQLNWGLWKPIGFTKLRIKIKLYEFALVKDILRRSFVSKRKKVIALYFNSERANRKLFVNIRI